MIPTDPCFLYPVGVPQCFQSETVDFARHARCIHSRKIHGPLKHQSPGYSPSILGRNHAKNPGHPIRNAQTRNDPSPQQQRELDSDSVLHELDSEIEQYNNQEPSSEFDHLIERSVMLEFLSLDPKKRPSLIRKLQKENKLSSPFATPTTPNLRKCIACFGSRFVPCAACGGLGELKRGAFSQKNSIKIDQLVGSKWTAIQARQGWRHFEVYQKLGVGKKINDLSARLKSVCANEIRPQAMIEIPLKELRSRELWMAGWVQKEELMNTAQLRTIPCPICKSRCVVPCDKCGCRGFVEVAK